MSCFVPHTDYERAIEVRRARVRAEFLALGEKFKELIPQKETKQRSRPKGPRTPRPPAIGALCDCLLALFHGQQYLSLRGTVCTA